MTEFKREERYIVIKISDLQNAENICQDSIDNLIDLEKSIAVYRSSEGKQPLKCAVIESDWPEYEPVWKMVESRVSGIGAYSLVPFMPTEKMIVAAAGANHSFEDKLLLAKEWQSMIRAAK